MDDNDLEKMFAKMDVPMPDPERRKETLNLAVSAFEAQKSAISKNNLKNAQGKSWLARLISQTTSERKDDMKTSKNKIVYGGLIGGLATACVALLVYGGDIMKPQLFTSNDGELISAPKVKAIAMNIDEGQSMQMAEAPPMQDISSSMQRAIEETNIAQVEMATRSGGSAMPMPVAPSKNIAPAPAGAQPMMAMQREMYAPAQQHLGRDQFERVEQNTIKQVKAEPVSTFSIDVDTSSYAFVRQSLDQGILPQKDSVRVEEMVNYFDYAYLLPTSREAPFQTSVIVKDSPWNQGKKVMTIGIKGYDVEKAAQPDSNLVFLLDTSGSMDEPKKLPLLKQSLSMLLDTLKPTDKISIVVYAGSAGTVLQQTPVSEKGAILQALNNLSAGGSTAGGEGIRMAYQLAQSNFNKDAVNRVILATDGDFNVGITNSDELQDFVEREREKGIFLSVIGFGQGNYNDVMMQKLAQNGNGVAAYIDTLNEARKVLVQEAAATLFPIAKDVKIQVEFNPAQVSEYRLVGYETRALKTEDFNNDKVDAGDIGAGAEVTAIYEITPAGGTLAVDPSRYEDDKPPVGHPDHKNDEVAFVKVRYKLPDQNKSELISMPVLIDQQAIDPVLLRESNWAEAVAGFGQLLKGGTYTGTLTYDDILKQAQANKGDDRFGYRAEFINLIYKAKTAASLPAQHVPGGSPDMIR